MPRKKSEEVRGLERQIANQLRREADVVKSLWEEIHREREATTAAVARADEAEARRQEQIKISAGIDTDFMRMCAARIHDREQIRRRDTDLATVNEALDALAAREIERSIKLGRFAHDRNVTEHLW